MVVLDNPAPFGNPLQFEITFECLQALEDDLEWKVVYVGSAESSTHDQTLDEILVGPVPVGINKFILQADAPDPSTIPQNDILGVTVILVTCSYREREFVRVGYYVNNEYIWDDDEGDETRDNKKSSGEDIKMDGGTIDDEDGNASGQETDENGENNAENKAKEKERTPPMPLDMNKVTRTILADKPRVTRFQINWGDLSMEQEEQQQQQKSQNELTQNDQGFGSEAASSSIAMPQDASGDATMISME